MSDDNHLTPPYQPDENANVLWEKVDNDNQQPAVSPDQPGQEQPGFKGIADTNPEMVFPEDLVEKPHEDIAMSNTTPPPVFTQEPEQEMPDTEPAMVNFTPAKSKLMTLLPFIGVILIVVFAIYFLFIRNGSIKLPGIGSSGKNAVIPKQQVNLIYWGLWEPTNVMEELINEYQSQNPHVKISYVEQSKMDYRQRLQSSIQNGQGPDIFRYHNTWYPMLQDFLLPDSKKVVKMDDVYTSIKGDAVIGGETYGVPLGYDNLVLYYNPQKYQAAGLSRPPADWKELIDYAEKLTIRDSKVGIQVAGVAMGTTGNIDHWRDIVGLLLLQSEVNPSEYVPAEVMEYYTQFSDIKRVWDSSLPSSTYAFATEKAAMIFGPSWRAHEIRLINPSLDFKTAPVPQLNIDAPVAWSSYWLEGVSAKSAYQDEAWNFLAFLSQPQNLTKLYTSASAILSERKFGEPYPRTNMADSVKDQEVVNSVLSQADIARSWYLCSQTYDAGLNDGIIKYFEDAINAMNKGSGVDTVLPTLNSGIQQKLGLYGIGGTAAPALQVAEPQVTP